MRKGDGMIKGVVKRARAAYPAFASAVMEVFSLLSLAVMVIFAYSYHWAGATFFLLLHWYCEHRAHLLNPKPIDSVIHCPVCGHQHIDKPEKSRGWTNPPHKSHLCSACGLIFRTADVPTNGVACVPSRGSADTWPE
jgi:predicted RNA-binding Zn-ribbon protein involved in translation (DUF1610 family)